MAPEPLPVAPASIANQLSMALSSQSSLIANMNMNPKSPRISRMSTATDHRIHQEEEAAENNTYGDEMAGIGYVRQGKNNSKSQGEDAALSKRLLGKRKIGGDAKKMNESKAVESSEDEDEGRGSLGKRKRPKRVSEPDEVDDSALVPAEVPKTKLDEGTRSAETDENPKEKVPVASPLETDGASSASKNKKKKKKNKRRKDAD